MPFAICQAREAELERTVQELGSALVVAKNRSSSAALTDNEEGGDNTTANENVAMLRARVSALELDLETSNANLSLERERVSLCFFFRPSCSQIVKKLIIAAVPKCITSKIDANYAPTTA